MDDKFIVLVSDSGHVEGIKVDKVGTLAEVCDYLEDFNFKRVFVILPMDGSWNMEQFEEHLEDFGLEQKDNGKIVLAKDD